MSQEDIIPVRVRNYEALGVLMQPSELFRRGIVLPTTQQAMDALAANDVREGMDVQCLEIRSDRDFYALWATGIFASINSLAGTRINDYEEAMLPPEYVAVLEVIVRTQELREESPTIRAYLQKLLNLCSAAIDFRMPLFFIF